MNIAIAIEGTPAAQKRHRHAKRGNFITTYDPSSGDKRVMQRQILNSLEMQKATVPLEKDVYLELLFYFEVPKSYSKKKLEELESKNYTYTKKPDVDNLVKLVMDAANGMLWKDDSQVYRITAEKRYGKESGIVMNVVYKD